nr:ATP-binding protein [Ramlibacter algicola]
MRLAGSITRPLRALHHTAAAAALGDFDQRAPEAGPAELAAVAAGFNRMLERLPELQREVRESAQRTEQLVERLSRHVPSMIFVYRLPAGGRARFSYASHAIHRIFGLTPADVEHDAQPMLDRVHPDDRDRVADTLRRSVRELVPFELAYRVLHPDGRVRHVLALAEAEPSEGETVWYGSVTDVTELRDKEVALREANETLEQRIAERTADLAAANSALEAFAYSVAHDLRAPLHSIEGFTEGVDHALAAGDVPRAQGFTRRVLANAVRMNLLIDGFLALAGAARNELDEAPFDLARVVQGVLADLAPPPHATVDVAPLPRVLGDAASLRQVWMNLLSNALKYSANQPRPVVRVDWRLQDDEAQFSVEDNGAGFDPDYAHKLFQPFSRLHKPQEFEGTGVGLAIVRRVVERHGGRAWAEARAEGGSRFWFSLPAARVLGPR